MLVMELWQLGDLVMATPFLRAAVETFDVTLVCKPFGKDLQPRFWPEVKVIPFLAPWTAFKGKYRLHAWPWREMVRLLGEIHHARFDVALSARGIGIRGDPRDHVLLRLTGARERLGFPSMGSQVFLTRPLKRPDLEAHRVEYWRVLGRSLGLTLPSRKEIPIPQSGPRRELILVHSGAGQPVRVWPLERYRGLAGRLRKNNFPVQVVCDPDQKDWWLAAGENQVAIPQTVTELLELVDRAALFIGNDSGPGHLAAMAGVPTFTLFGPQLPEWFAPLHPESAWMEGKACPYKPCWDECCWRSPLCLENMSEDEAWVNIERFVVRQRAMAT